MQITVKNKTQFRQLLMQWHNEENKRSMPWKGEKNAYKVWLSEIILQQTRVEQGWAYYENFIRQYPTIMQLANAKDEDVFKLWEGLGYYTRCKNLLHTARTIVEKYNGQFPSDYNSILSLKGIGNYTASAIASFCFNQPYAVVDGNVLRVLARYFGVGIAIDSTAGKNYFTALANDCLDKNKPGAYNQSIMDFGATVCKPVPLCPQCLLNKTCAAYRLNSVAALPVKAKNIVKKERWFSYFIFSFNNKIFVRQRTAKDIWQNLHEFYLEETTVNPEWDIKKAAQWLHETLKIARPKNISIIRANKQALTHQIIRGYFIYVELSSAFNTSKTPGSWMNEAEIETKAFPQFIHQFTRRKPIQAQVL